MLGMCEHLDREIFIIFCEFFALFNHLLASQHDLSAMVTLKDNSRPPDGCLQRKKKESGRKVFEFSFFTSLCVTEAELEAERLNISSVLFL